MLSKAKDSLQKVLSSSGLMMEPDLSLASLLGILALLYSSRKNDISISCRVRKDLFLVLGRFLIPYFFFFLRHLRASQNSSCSLWKATISSEYRALSRAVHNWYGARSCSLVFFSRLRVTWKGQCSQSCKHMRLADCHALSFLTEVVVVR